MNHRKTFLILVILFSLLFVALVAAGSHLMSVGNKTWALALFLFAFAAAFGQIGTLAAYIMTVAREQAARQAAARSDAESVLPDKQP